MSGRASSSAEVPRSEDFDSREFRRCVSKFGTGVTVITAEVGGQRVGVTANSFSSLSLDPPLVLWSIARSSRSFAAFQKASHFAINILGSDQIAVSQAFSSSAEDKFAGIRWSPGVTGAPVVEGAVGVIECQTDARFDGGDHVILVGRVKRFERRDGESLLFVDGRYGIAVDHPDSPMRLRAVEADSKVGKSDPAGTEPQHFFRLLFQAFYRMSESFDEHRYAESVNLLQLRVLVGAYEEPGVSLEKLCRVMYITRPDAADVIEELRDRGDLTCEPGKGIVLTRQGRQRREAIARREAEFERLQLAGLPDSEVAQARTLLSKLIDRNNGSGESTS